MKSRPLDRLIVSWVAVVLVLALVPSANHIASATSAASAVAKPTVPFTPRFYNFESTLSPWTGGTLSGGSVTLGRFNTENACPTNGSWYADLKGGQGTASEPLYWLQTSFPYPGAPQFSVLVEFKAKVIANCSKCKYEIYVGTEAPTSADQFTPIGDGYLTTSWEEYEYLITLNNVSGPIYIAVGFHGDNTGTSEVGFDCGYLLFPF